MPMSELNAFLGIKKKKKYEQVALKAMNKIESNNETPIIAWEKASIELLGRGTTSQKKCCPKNFFLGLCEIGKIEGIPKGHYLIKSKSKEKYYAIKALDILNKEKSLLENKKNLWKEITVRKHNGQLDVFFALYENGYIRL